MNKNIIYFDGEGYEIVNEINVSKFQNKNGSVNEYVLGLYVHEWDANRVLQKDDKFLICRLIEEVKYEEL